MAVAHKARCLQCQHYYITWDKRHPYGCKKLGFKAAIEPALVVWRAYGQQCLAFEPKPPRQRP